MWGWGGDRGEQGRGRGEGREGGQSGHPKIT